MTHLDRPGRIGAALLTSLALASTPACAEDLVTASPSPLTGLWWNANESGWGASIAQHGTMIFLAWYAYDAAGNPAWYVIPSCPIVGNACAGDMYTVAGGTPLTAPWDGSALAPDRVGSGRLRFTDNDSGTFEYTLHGVAASRAITRQPLAAGPSPPPVDYSDLWWNAEESGWGIALTQQQSVIFATLFSYDEARAPTWYVAPNCRLASARCFSDLYEVHGGTPPTMPWNGSGKVPRLVGTAEISFHDAASASMRLVIDGAEARRQIVREAFGGRGGPVVAHSDVIDAIRAETNGSFCVADGHDVTDAEFVPTASVYYGEGQVPSRDELWSAVLAAGGRVDSSTPAEFCFTLAGESGCVRQFGNALVTEYQAAAFTAVQIHLTGLVPGGFSDISFDTDRANAMVVSWKRAPCSGSALVPGSAINGQWYGYKFAYSMATKRGTTSLATMSCTDLRCTLLGETSATFDLVASGYWRTPPGAPRLAGAQMSSDQRLLTAYLCSSPLDETRTLEQCGFYTFRRDG